MTGTFHRAPRSRPAGRLPPRRGFTLVEMLVVIAVLALLAALLVPALGRAKAAGERGLCFANLGQLHKANELYAGDAETYVPAAADIRGANLQRWHGVRASRSKEFDGTRGPLAKYLGDGRSVRACPALRDMQSGFEKGCGGYGYNQIGVGSQSYLLGSLSGAVFGAKSGSIADPSRTVMFTDTAFLDGSGGQPGLIEYSFAESYLAVSESPPVSETYPLNPTIHFRHRGLAAVAWCDGHASPERMTTVWDEAYTGKNLGWFGGADNALFDPF